MLLLCSSFAYGQGISAGVNTMHDENIFDTYIPIHDQVTQLNLGLGKAWDYDQFSLDLLYEGQFVLYNSISARNYSMHSVFIGSLYHFENNNDESSDSTDAGDDSSTAPRPLPGYTETTSNLHTDSLDHYLTALLIGFSQFNKIEFDQYDNALISGVVYFRQPVGAALSLRPGYSFSYHDYPHLSALSNFQNTGILLLGISPSQSSWLSVTGSFGFERYLENSLFTFTYTDTIPGAGSGHGKSHGGGTGGSSGSVRSHSAVFQFTNPSVNQLSASAGLRQNFSAQSVVDIQVMLYATPSTTARVIPERIQNAMESHPGTFGSLTSENEIFDDHFTYSGTQTTVQFKQQIPFKITMELDGIYRGKTFTSPATSVLGDTLASHRIDNRYETGLIFSRPITIGENRVLTLTTEFHYVRNMSNEPFYDFGKTVFLAGIQYAF